jgi:cytochrome c553
MKTYLAITSIVAVSLFTNISQAADVKENWEKHCLKCHGADGKGETNDMPVKMLTNRELRVTASGNVQDEPRNR